MENESRLEVDLSWQHAVDRLTARLLSELQALLGGRLVGLYLHGSLALEAFNPYRSDVDFVAVTDGDLPPDTLAALASLHARLRAEGLPWADHLEGSYIPLVGLRRYDSEHADFPALRVDGSFGVDRHGPDWVIQRWVLREKGISLYGPPPAGLIDPIGGLELRRAALGTLLDWWQPMLENNPRFIHAREYQAYAVLTMCRALYTLANERVVSKPQAARWYFPHAGRWQRLIERANAYPEPPQEDALDETLAFIRHTIERARQVNL